MITKTNLLNHEMIGLDVEVCGKTVKGVVIDETKNTFTIRSKKGDKVIPKAKNNFLFKTGKEAVAVEGEIITQRPYERLRKKYKVKNKWQEILE